MCAECIVKQRVVFIVDHKNCSLATCHPPMFPDPFRNTEVVARNVQRINDAIEFYFYATNTKIFLIASFTPNAIVKVSQAFIPMNILLPED